MYKLIDIDYLIGERNYLAHRDGHDEAKENLKQHMIFTLKYFDEYSSAKGLQSKIKNILRTCELDDSEVEQGYSLFVNAVYLHDIGKINPGFQYKAMKNDAFKKSSYDSSEHSIFSAFIYIYEHIKLFPRLGRRLTYALYSFAYVISCHHGKLISLDGFNDKLQYCSIEKFYEGELEDWFEELDFIAFDGERVKQNIGNPEAFFILNRLLYACITSCDFSATGQYMNGNSYSMTLITDIQNFSEKYYANELYRGIKAYTKKDFAAVNEINDLRTEMFLEAEEGLLKNINSNIFYLEAPTGSGKTNCSINLALKIMENDSSINNLFYIFPFNTLVEQTAETLTKYFSNTDAVVVNSITPIIDSAEDKDELDYEELLMNRINNNYPIVVTTHINFFNMLFGIDREQCFPLIKLCNSVVIIDEIQSYKNYIWPEIISFLSSYANLLNIKIIIMSATLPRVDESFGFEGGFCTLLADSGKYYSHPIFKDRVAIDTSLMKYDDIQFEHILNKVLEYKEDKKVLVEFVSKKGARDFYNLCIYKCPELKENIFELSGDDCSLTRKEVIKRTKENKPMILIATQVIEAGVDIDMDVGFKEISLPDSEEQFLGRINRSCRKRGCKAYFFKKSKVESIYKKDVRANHTIQNEKVMHNLVNKDFGAIYRLVLDDLRVSRSKKNADNFYIIKDTCRMLKFKELKKQMELIEPSIQVFICYKYKVENIEIDGSEIWNQYLELVHSKESYARKKVGLSAIRASMTPFIFNIPLKDNDRERIPFDDVGGIYFVEEGEDFIEDGKFNRKLFEASFNGRFL